MEEPNSPHRNLEPFELEACELLLTARAAEPSGALTHAQGAEQRGVNGPSDELHRPALEVCLRRPRTNCTLCAESTLPPLNGRRAGVHGIM